MYAKLDEPRAVVERRVARKARQLFTLGLILVGLPVAAYVAGIYHIAPLDGVFPGGAIAPAQWVPVIGMTVPGVGLLALVLIRHVPLVRRGQQTEAWVESVGWEVQHTVRVKFGYEVAGKDYRITRLRPEVEVARYDRENQMMVVYDPRNPARADVVVIIVVDDLVSRLTTSVMVNFRQLGPRLLFVALVSINVGLLGLIWKASGATERVENTMIWPCILAMVGFSWLELRCVQRRRAVKRGIDWATSPIEKLKIALLFVGVIVWGAWSINSLRAPAPAEVPSAPLPTASNPADAMPPRVHR